MPSAPNGMKVAKNQQKIFFISGWKPKWAKVSVLRNLLLKKCSSPSKLVFKYAKSVFAVLATHKRPLTFVVLYRLTILVFI